MDSGHQVTRRAASLAVVALFVAAALGLAFLWFKSVGYGPRCLVVECRIVKK